MSEGCQPVKSAPGSRTHLRAALVGVLLSYVICAGFIIGHEVVGPSLAQRVIASLT